jgi:hypothetical protein
LFDRFGAKVCTDINTRRKKNPMCAHYLGDIACSYWLYFLGVYDHICKSYYQFLLAQGILGGVSMGNAYSCIDLLFFPTGAESLGAKSGAGMNLLFLSQEPKRPRSSQLL